jgi:hypothetical protein
MNKLILVTVFLAINSILANAQVRQQINLNDGWLVKSLKESESIPADLPNNFENHGLISTRIWVLS